ncbi:MAG: maleylacetate reductase [Gammaproteobacteria bacterium]|nr:maleylacetate reductase [Gammaproteobacteria bacterium]
MSQISTAAVFQFNYAGLESVSVGERVEQVLPALMEKYAAQRVFLLATGSLSRATDQFEELQAALGGRCAGLFDGITAHSPREQVLQALAAVRTANADLLVSLGGGSIIDAVKVVQLALDQGIETAAQLLDYAQFSDGLRGSKAGDMSLFGKPARIRQIAVPTTLSGAEFSNNAGVLDTRKLAKESYRGMNLCPRNIIYDPQLAMHTPEWLWLSTAIRSLDHAIEGYCSAATNAFLDGHFLHAMRLFAESLPQTRQHPQDARSRSLNQQAVWLAGCGLGTVAHGASHGIGYILGSLCGVPHGYTSCVMLPAVLEWNSHENAQRQTAIATALGRPGASAAIAVRDLVTALGMPTTLRAVGVSADMLPEIAMRAIKHPVVRSNPRRLESAAQIEEILQLAW